jgi:hypothetical protein
VTADATGGESPQVIKVRTELVLEQLVSRVLGRTLELCSDDQPAEVQQVLEAAPEPRELARLGYAARVAETEMFEPARQPMPWLSDLLDDRAASKGERPAAIRSVCSELAGDEPDEKPDPGEGSWRVPGPGGHVRHFLALAAADELTHSDSNGEPVIHRELSAGEVKRCFLYGFYTRCCEEAADR